MYSNIETDAEYDLLNFIIKQYGEEDELKIELEQFLNTNLLMNDLKNILKLLILKRMVIIQSTQIS